MSFGGPAFGSAPYGDDGGAPAIHAHGSASGSCGGRSFATGHKGGAGSASGSGGGFGEADFESPIPVVAVGSSGGSASASGHGDHAGTASASAGGGANAVGQGRDPSRASIAQRHKARRHRKPEFITAEQLAAQHREWLGLPPLPEPEPTPEGYEYEVTGLQGFRVRAAGTVEVELQPRGVAGMRVAGPGQVEAELHHFAPHEVAFSAASSEVGVELAPEGRSGFRARSRGQVDRDLWMDKPITEEEAREALKKVRRLTKV